MNAGADLTPTAAMPKVELVPRLVGLKLVIENNKKDYFVQVHNSTTLLKRLLIGSFIERRSQLRSLVTNIKPSTEPLSHSFRFFFHLPITFNTA